MFLDWPRKYQSIIILILAVIATAAVLIFTLPAENDYLMAADEGTYYRQAQALSVHGRSAFNDLAEQYIKNTGLQLSPPPTRLGYPLTASFLVGIYDSPRSLSFVSLISYLLLIIFTFVYAKKFWGEKTALLLALLMCVSPIGLGMARRALNDSEFYLFAALTFFSFLDYLRSSKDNRFYLFCLLLAVPCLIKETGFILLPFYIGSLIVLKMMRKGPVQYRHILLSALVPLTIAAASFTLAFKTPGGICLIYKIFLITPNAYVQWLQGPWYTYMLEYLLLSPVLTIGAIAYLGSYLFFPKKDVNIVLAAALFIYNIIIFSFFIKSARYVMIIDLLLRLFMALLLIEVDQRLAFSKNARKIFWLVVVFVLVSLELASFRHYFLINKVYDPIAYNLLRAENIIPANIQFIVPAEQNMPSKPDPADAYFKQGFIAYNQKKYEKSIEFNLMAIRIRPDFVEAYSNLGAAYGALARWDEEIAACEKALALNPTYILAKNNLAYAKKMRLKR